ncbi:MAG: hypothetical protein WC717_00715 [Candidatus Micrarchaeia archaeon]|jgi:hypothetical protein
MNELTFLDLVILKKIDDGSSVENFGSTINTSFFETANLLGTVKIKGYISIETSIGGISKVAATDAGKGIMALAEKKASEPIEPLDNALLHALAGGAKDPEALQAQLNIRSGDLAYHINKLAAQGFIDYEVRSAKASLMLTEQGFNSTGGVKVQGAPAAHAAAQQPEAEKGKEEEGEKDDIFHILRGLDKEEREPHGKKHGGHAHEKHEREDGGETPEGHSAPLGPEEMKKQVHKRRMASKLRYYIAEYWAWLLLLFLAAAIVAGAVYTSILKLG